MRALEALDVVDGGDNGKHSLCKHIMSQWETGEDGDKGLANSDERFPQKKDGEGMRVMAEGGAISLTRQPTERGGFAGGKGSRHWKNEPSQPRKKKRAAGARSRLRKRCERDRFTRGGRRP